jgi:hypothetical protein
MLRTFIPFRSQDGARRYDNRVQKLIKFGKIETINDVIAKTSSSLSFINYLLRIEQRLHPKPILARMMRIIYAVSIFLQGRG